MALEEETQRKAEALYAGLAAALGLAELPSEEGAARLSLDGAGEFSLQAVPPDLLMLTADLGSLPAELAPAALAAPLESGELVGLSLLREEGGTALLAASLPLSASGPEAVAAVLERLAAAEEAVRNEGLAPFLRRIVPNTQSPAALSTEQGGGAEPPSQRGIQV